MKKRRIFQGLYLHFLRDTRNDLLKDENNKNNKRKKN